MRLSTFVVKNVRRRPIRSILTITAVALGVGAVVSLVGIAVGFKQSFLKLYGEVGIDLLVVKGRVGRQLESGIRESLIQEVAKIPGVKEILPGVSDVISFPEEGLYMVLVNGWVPETFVFDHLKLIDGRFLRKDDHRKVMLGSILATNLNKKVGDRVEIYEEEWFDVIGIFDSFSVLETGSFVVPMAELQPLIGREDQLLGMSIITTNSSDPELIHRVQTEIEKLEPGIIAKPTREQVEGLTEIQLANAMAWLTSTVALVIGCVGVMNTMIMSVQERTREIGILRAIGWRRWRIVWMVLLESLLLGLVGAVVGVVAAIALVKLLTRLPIVNGLIEGTVEPYVVVYGLVLALVLGLLGGLLPAWFAARLSPTTALRHE